MLRTVAIASTAIVIALSLGFFAAADIVYLRLDGSINPVTRDIVDRGIALAERDRAEAVLIELNTPGGLEASMRDIIARILASESPIIVYVAPSGARAASAGTLITLAADIAAMAPGTNIGAATPVSLIGDGGAVSLEKATNDAAAFARAIAQQRNRNEEWAELTVTEGASLSAQEALTAGVIDVVVDDIPELLAWADGVVLADGRILRVASVPMRRVRPTLRERLLGYLADPNVVYVLFVLGLFGLIYEFFQPGVGFGLAAGGICLALALFGMQILPVRVVGLGLVLFGMGLMALDAFTPTNGVLTAGGIAALAAGSLALFDLPGSLGLSWVTISVVLATISALFLFVVGKGLAVQRQASSTGMEAMLGRHGTVKTPLAPTGRVFVHGEYWSARVRLESATQRVEPGDRVVVVDLAGGTLIVERLDQPDRDT